MRRFRSWTTLWLSLGLLAVAALAISPWRHFVLQSVGWALVAGDPDERADVIVIATDAGGAGVLEAADLIKAGVASRIAVFSDPPGTVDREFLKRDVAYLNPAALSIQQLHALGITSVEEIPPTVTGTEDEGRELPRWCLEKGFHTIIFVSKTDHSRRSRRVLARATRDVDLKVIVRPSRYSDFNPDTWWRTRSGVRIEIIELEKLLLDILRHPLS
jgi:hypothetical protein